MSEQTTEARQISDEAKRDALSHARNSGIIDAWKCVREMFQDGKDVQAWAEGVHHINEEDPSDDWAEAKRLLQLAQTSSSQPEAERASPSGLAAYRPQHDDKCASRCCSKCSRVIDWTDGACGCAEYPRSAPHPCSCGLDALLKSAEGKDGQ